jgi:hypothetical protein
VDTRLVTYAELAETLGIAVDSAKRLARRRRWQKQPGNDGLARVAVPLERLVRPDVPADVSADVPEVVPADIPEDGRGDVGAVIRALEQHNETLKDMLSKAEAAMERERERADGASDRARLAEAEAASVPALKDTVAALKTALESEKIRVGELRAERDQLNARRSWWPFRRAG